MSERYPFEPDWAFAPGEYIQDEMRERGLSMRTVSRSLHMSRAAFSRLLLGKRRLDEYTAVRVAWLFGGSAQTWLNLEAFYRRHIGMVPQ